MKNNLPGGKAVSVSDFAGVDLRLFLSRPAKILTSRSGPKTARERDVSYKRREALR
jgi:hypothetical protein